MKKIQQTAHSHNCGKHKNNELFTNSWSKWKFKWKKKWLKPHEKPAQVRQQVAGFWKEKSAGVSTPKDFVHVRGTLGGTYTQETKEIVSSS